MHSAPVSATGQHSFVLLNDSAVRSGGVSGGAGCDESQSPRERAKLDIQYETEPKADLVRWRSYSVLNQNDREGAITDHPARRGREKRLKRRSPGAAAGTVVVGLDHR